MADIKSTHSGGVIRVKVPAGAWSAVPVALVEDARLSLESRAVAAYLATRPPGWQIAIEPMLRAVPLGRSVWRRVARELQDAGYLTRSRQPTGERGRFVWHITFCAVPAERSAQSTIVRFSIDGRTIDGRTIDGEPAYKNQKDLNQMKKRSQKETREKARALSSPPARPLIEIDERTGVSYQSVNSRDVQAMEAIQRYPKEAVEKAVQAAAAGDPQKRAWPTSVLRLLLQAKRQGQGEGETLRTWLTNIAAAGEDAIPAGDPVFQYAETAGIPVDFLMLQWHEFKQRYKTSDKRYKDWREVFRKSVRGNWFHLWAMREGGEVMLTTMGVQANRVMQATDTEAHEEAEATAAASA